MWPKATDIFSHSGEGLKFKVKVSLKPSYLQSSRGESFLSSWGFWWLHVFLVLGLHSFSLCLHLHITFFPACFSVLNIPCLSPYRDTCHWIMAHVIYRMISSQNPQLAKNLLINKVTFTMGLELGHIFWKVTKQHNADTLKSLKKFLVICENLFKKLMFHH